MIFLFKKNNVKVNLYNIITKLPENVKYQYHSTNININLKCKASMDVWIDGR